VPGHCAAPPAGACCGLAWKTPFYNRCGAGKWAVAGRESEAAAVLVEPQDRSSKYRSNRAPGYSRASHVSNA
jgi:hypothetical protein